MFAPKRIWMKPCSKTRSDKSTCANIFLELPLTILFRHYLGMNATSCYWSYIDFYTLITYNYILTDTYNSDTAPGAEFISGYRRCSLKFCKFHSKAPVLESLFYKASGLQRYLKRLLRRCFPVKFEKLWRTLILTSVCTTASVYWLLHIFDFYKPLQ